MTRPKKKSLPGAGGGIDKQKSNKYWNSEDPRYSDIKGEILASPNQLDENNPINEIVKTIGEWPDNSCNIKWFSGGKL